MLVSSENVGAGFSKDHHQQGWARTGEGQYFCGEAVAKREQVPTGPTAAIHLKKDEFLSEEWGAPHGTGDVRWRNWDGR